MQSFGLVPVTNNHPPELLNDTNTRKFQIGSIINPRQDDEFVAGSLLITDRETIADVEGGKVELSCGYSCELLEQGGITDGIEGVPDGLKYDAVQVNIQGNHVAIVSKGRAGSGASLRLDEQDAVNVTDGSFDNKPGAPAPIERVNTMRIDKIDYEIGDQAEQAVCREFERKDKEIVELQAKVDESTESLSKEKARADELDEKQKELQAKYDEASDPAKVQARVDERVALVSQAKEILGEKSELKLDEMTGAEIKKAVVLSKTGENFDTSKLDDETYLNTRYDIECEKADAEPKTSPGEKGLAGVRGATPRADGKAHRDAATARAEMIAANKELKPLGKQVSA